MIPFQRQQEILKSIKDGKVVGINDLAIKLNVSHMTIRRDLQKLENEGLVSVVSGGVHSPKKLSNELSHIAKEALNLEEKKRIGKEAAKYIPKNSCIYLDAGTTSLALAQYLIDRKDITVITNDFEVINYLIENGHCSLIHIGGYVRVANRSSVGHLAAQTISSLRIDVAFLSSSSFDTTSVTTPDMDKVVVKKAILDVSNKKILISDSSKYACVATYLAFYITDVNTIITDSKLPIEAKKQIEKQGVEVITV